MQLKKQFKQILSGTVFTAGVSSALVVPDNTVATNSPGAAGAAYNLNWNYTYYYKSCSASAVASNWIVTAGHVADDGGTGNLTVDGEIYTQKEIVFHPTADLALVRYDKTFPGFYPLYTGTFPTTSFLKKSAVITGYGYNGTTHTTNWTAGSSGRGERRWGTQKIEGNYQWPVTNGTFVSQSIIMYFNSSDTPYECGYAVGDSGGGIFIKDGGTWKIAGINTYTATRYAQYDTLLATSIPAYAGWINSVIDPLADYDGDGIPNGWESQYSSSITGLVAAADTDGDGYSNLKEYLEGTDPTDPESYFKIDSFEAGDLQTVYFYGNPARQYWLTSVSDLLNTNWLAASPVFPGTGSNSSITVTNSGAAGFYRLNVSLP